MKNSPYFVYQYLLNIADADVGNFLRLLTFMGLDEIDRIVEDHERKPELRLGQKALAGYVTEIIFGQKAGKQAEMISDMLFGSAERLEILKTLSKEDIDALAKETGSCSWNPDISILDLLVGS